MKNRIILVFVVVLLLFSGCYSSSPVANIPAANELTASLKINFRLNDGLLAQSNLIKASSREDAYLDFNLELYNYADSSWQKSLVKKRVTVSGGIAEVEFAALPCQPAILTIDFLNCSIEGKNSFHGAADLKPGENILTVVPVAGNLIQNVVVSVLTRIIEEEIDPKEFFSQIVSLAATKIQENLEAQNVAEAAFSSTVNYLNDPDGSFMDIPVSPVAPVIPETEPKIEILIVNQQTFPAVTNETIEMIASFSDLNNNITLVEMYINGKLTDQIKPAATACSHIFKLEIQQPGEHEISCRVFDKAFNTAFSNTLSLNLKTGFSLPADQPYELIFSNLSGALSSTLNFQQVSSIASISTPESQFQVAEKTLLRMSDISSRKDQTKRFDQSIEILKQEWALQGIKPDPGSLRASQFSDIAISDEWQFNIRNPNTGYSAKETFYKQAENNECIVFVMESSSVSEACLSKDAAEKVAMIFGEHNPLHPQGIPIAQVNRSVFGTEWLTDGGRDQEERLLILIYRSDYGSAGSYGYFRPVDQLYPEGGYQNYYSNGGEIIYINETVTSSIQEIVSTVAHEFQHCIFMNQAIIKDGDFSGSSDSSLFLNEGCAMLASELNYGEQPQMTDFAAECLHDSLSSFSIFGLVDFEGYSMDYGRAWLLVKYIYEKSGQSHLQQIIKGTPEFYNAQLSPAKSNENFLLDWHCAMRLSGRPGCTSAICYNNLDLFQTISSTEGTEYILEGSLVVSKTSEEMSIFPISAPGVSCNLSVQGENHLGKVYVDFLKDGVGARSLMFDINGNFSGFKQIERF